MNPRRIEETQKLVEDALALFCLRQRDVRLSGLHPLGPHEHDAEHFALAGEYHAVSEELLVSDSQLDIAQFFVVELHGNSGAQACGAVHVSLVSGHDDVWVVLGFLETWWWYSGRGEVLAPRKEHRI